MRTGLLAVAAFALMGCGQGAPLLGGFADGWQILESRDQLTGVATQTAHRVVQIENGTTELSATCKGEQLLFGVDEWGEAAPRGIDHAVEFRLTFLGPSETRTFTIGSTGAQVGVEHSVNLRASIREGETAQMVVFVDHVNSFNTLLPAAALVGANAPTAFRIEVPLLLADATTGSPPLAQTVVVDLTPQDENLQRLISSCAPNSESSLTQSPTAVPQEAAAGENVPAVSAMVFGVLPDDTFESGAGCSASVGNSPAFFGTDFSSGAIQLNGRTIRLTSINDEGTEFSDGAGITTVRLRFLGDAVAAGEDASAMPAMLTVLSNGSAQEVSVTYLCAS